MVDQDYDGSGQPIQSDGDSTAQSNDGGQTTDQQTGDSSGVNMGPEATNDQSQNRAQTDANLGAARDRQAGEIDDPNNPSVETRPPEQTAPNEETPGYEPQNQ